MTNDGVYEVKLHTLHPFQQAIKDSKAKRKIVRAGRRGGKTVLASDITVDSFLDGHRVLYAVPTGDQLTKWWFEVKQALKPLVDANPRVFKFNETEKTVEKIGTENRIRGKTAYNAQTLRGDYADVLILDEVQNMTEDTWDEVGAPMLLDNDGDALFIFTPPSVRSRAKSKAKNKMWVVSFWQKHFKDPTGRWACFAFTSFDNPFISKNALGDIMQDMTSLAYRQEIMAENVLEAPGALWTRETLERYRVAVAPASFTRIGVAIDPSLTSSGDEAGILAGGISAENGEYYVLADKSLQASPLEWAKQAVLLYSELLADYIIIEKNAGGEMLELTLTQAAGELKTAGRIKDADIRFVYVNATRGKMVRADPVSAMYERGVVHHVGQFHDLEDELTFFTGVEQSPNRLDALVWLMTMLKSAGGPSDVEIQAYAKADEQRRLEELNRLAQADPPADGEPPKPTGNDDLDDIAAYLRAGQNK